ncbi:hypothetical protein [Streptomyces sp. CAU 1734]|uniref:hypothetical protein n=1 Tax=Streptomyces sp. CAU 1734 TaxID=3140360 RepID=UPI00326168A8
MRTGTLSPGATGAPRPGRPRAEAPRVVVVSLDPAASLAWVARLRRACPLRLVVRPWGDQLGYEYLRRATGVLALLDSTAPEPVAELVQRVRSLRLLAPVTVSSATRVDTEALLGAGALNVLRRDTSAAVAAARITADLRWLCRSLATERTGHIGPAGHGGGSGASGASGASGVSGVSGAEEPCADPLKPSHRSQSLLLEILLGARAPLCCHDVRYLLGEASRPMSLPALRARIQRLAPHLAQHGLVCRRTVRWGADTFTLHPAGSSGASGAGPRPAPGSRQHRLPA